MSTVPNAAVFTIETENAADAEFASVPTTPEQSGGGGTHGVWKYLLGALLVTKVDNSAALMLANGLRSCCFTFSTLIIMVDIVMFSASTIVGNGFSKLSENPGIGPTEQGLYYTGACNAYALFFEYQVFRAIVPMFLHATIWQLLTSVAALHTIVRVVEYNKHRFVAIAVFFMGGTLGVALGTAYSITESVTAGMSGISAVIALYITMALDYPKKPVGNHQKSAHDQRPASDQKTVREQIQVILPGVLAIALIFSLSVSPHTTALVNLPSSVFGMSVGFVLSRVSWIKTNLSTRARNVIAWTVITLMWILVMCSSYGILGLIIATQHRAPNSSTGSQ